MRTHPYNVDCECSGCSRFHGSTLVKFPGHNIECQGDAFHTCSDLCACPVCTNPSMRSMNAGIAYGPSQKTPLVTSPVVTAKQPTNCGLCNHYNEYAGPEHVLDGMYVCRTCRPAYERRAALKELERQNAERKKSDPSHLCQPMTAWWSVTP